MDTIISSIFSWQFIFLCLTIFGIVFVIRRIFEYLFLRFKPIWKDTKFWNELILPLLPLIVGIAFSLVAKFYPYPNITSISGRFVFCFAASLLSGLVYRILKAFLVSKIATGPNIDDEKAITGQFNDIAKPKP